MRVIVLAAMIGQLAGCKDFYNERKDEYHGGPSSRVCGVRWSHDVIGFNCDGPRLRLDELRPFTEAVSIRISDTVVEAGAGARLDAVTQLNIGRSKFDTALLVATFPRVEGLSFNYTAVDVHALEALGALRFLQLSKTSPPDAAAVAALPRLKTLMLTFLECPKPGCGQALAAQIRVLRPDLEVRVHDVVP